MKKNTMPKNPYATNRGGRIVRPNAPDTETPKATVTRGDDLRK